MNSSSPLISVCIVTYQRDRDLLHSLQQLSRSEFQDYEILIVDNGPSTELPQLIQELNLANPWRLIPAPENRGCANLNLLFPAARGQIIACFDDDSYPADDCLGHVAKIFPKTHNWE
ncbi:MAG: glycosyltransferase family 2 protein [Akkermansiaceae bacterium]|nr:glycosyltransferase family 2 protein [Akkermansiaceae bacterium]